MKIKSRLYCPYTILHDGQSFSLDEKQAHYVRHVMRANIGDYFGIFNGTDGEYACKIIDLDKKKILMKPISNIKPHLPPTHLALIFAVIKKNPLEFLVQKSTELGVGILQPIITEHTIIRDVNQERLTSITIEAAEQCGLTAIPIIKPLNYLSEVISKYNRIIFCDERPNEKPIRNCINQNEFADAILIGPEGGFSEQEANFLYQQKNVISVSLGNRIMRAETAAIASLAIIQSLQEYYL